MRSFAFLAVAGIALAACSSDPDPGTGGSGGSSSSKGTGGGDTGGAPPVGPVSGAVQRYEYAFDLATAHAKSTLKVAVAEPGGDCYSVSCLAPAASVTWNDAPAATASFENEVLTACGPGAAADSTLTLTAEADIPEKTFLGLDIGFSRKKNMDGGTFTYLLSWVGGCDRFGPCDDDPSRLASFHFDVTHAAGDVVLCPGALTAGETSTTCEIDGTLAPTYSAFSIASDPLWKRNEWAKAAGVDLVFYEVPSGQLAATLEKESVVGFMEWITGVVGPFPYGNELRFAGGPTDWLGFEHPASVILQEELPSLAVSYENPTMHVLMHEVVHQWAGDRTTLASAMDFVWKEATAEYLSYVYEDEHRPSAEAASSLAYWDSVALQASFYPRPTDDPPPAVHTFYGHVYGPGPMVLYIQLESMLGREAVLDGVASFLAEPGARSVDELRAAIEKASGKDLKPYFDAWVFGSGKPEWPTFAVTTEQAGEEVTVTVTQQNGSSKLYGCAVEVEVKGANSTTLALVDFGLDPKSPAAFAKVTLGEPVTGTVLDPNHRVVAREAGAKAAPEPILPVWPL